ncbi:unnamed protein product [Fraxinus pennsylvanica]|uniref:Uncharacterized protein n=1 Tax=Fraxinus pennsylvanica TaxID=56036 RepID=A0AAD2AFJ2_9LAMI|nr:unnamed protein product [Fraxinus pennsylvanica]
MADYKATTTTTSVTATASHQHHNGRCHKLPLGLASERLRQLKMRISSGGNPNYVDEMGEDFEIHYQEPSESYFGDGIPILNLGVEIEKRGINPSGKVTAAAKQLEKESEYKQSQE